MPSKLKQADFNGPQKKLFKNSYDFTQKPNVRTCSHMFSSFLLTLTIATEILNF